MADIAKKEYMETRVSTVLFLVLTLYIVHSFPFLAEEKSEYMISYIHPCDLDAGQPMIDELLWLRRFKSYVELKGAEGKLRRLLTDFPFTDLAAANRLVDWAGAPVIEL